MEGILEQGLLLQKQLDELQCIKLRVFNDRRKELRIRRT